MGKSSLTFLVSVIGLLNLSFHTAHADTTLCFKFSNKVTRPLRDPIGFQGSDDTSQFGIKSDQIKWAATRGIVDKPVQTVIQKLLDPKTIKGPKLDIEITSLEKPPYISFKEVKVYINPFPLISIRWTEEWAYTLIEGTEKTPKSVLISYQKTEGTSHIDQFCGSVLIKKLSDTKTDVFIYEELKASRRSPEDLVKGNIGTLNALRKGS